MARLGRLVRVAVCAALGTVAVVSAVPKEIGEAAVVAKVRAHGYAVVDAVDGSIAAAINRKVHARVAVGACSGGRGEIFSTSNWLNKDCALPVNDADTFAVLGNLTRALAGVVKAVAGPDARLCEHAAMIAYPGAAPTDVTYPEKGFDFSDNAPVAAVVTVVVFLDGVVDESAAPLHVPDRRSLRGPPPTAKLAPLQPGAVVVYDARLERRFAANDASPRSTFYFSYCAAGAAESTMLPEDRGYDDLGLGLADVVARSRPDTAPSTSEQRKSDDEACLDMFIRAAGDSMQGAARSRASDLRDDMDDDARRMRGDFDDFDDFGVSTATSTYDSDAYLRLERGLERALDYSYEFDDYFKTEFYEFDDHFYDGLDEYGDAYSDYFYGSVDGDLGILEYFYRGFYRAGDDGDLDFDRTQFYYGPAYLNDKAVLDDSLRLEYRSECVALRATVAASAESEQSRFPPCTWPVRSSTRDDVDVYARMTMALFRRVFERDECGRCGDDLLAAFSEVGVFRRSSTLWDVVDRDLALASAPPGRRDVLEQAHRVVERLVTVAQEWVERVVTVGPAAQEWEERQGQASEQ
ncbi:hypothetical protein M885DRAFT_585708 [Pelagophyceae sp. CCMP2097]|nr:hypothetical protein M885DRAFT_585708 [Pelagophyceae sp. CCMP2097]